MRMMSSLVCVACALVVTHASVAQSFIHMGGGLIPVTAAGPRGFADVDADGDVDLVAPNTAVFLNDGNGSFVKHPTQSPAFGSATPGASAIAQSDVLLHDVDGNGTPDFLGWYQGAAQLAINNGSGVFTAANANFPALPSPLGVMSLVPGDFDGDGDADLFVLTRNPSNGGCLVGSVPAPCAHPPHLWLNNGAGVFVSASPQLPAGLIARARQGVAADFDGDGDCDVVYAQYNAAPVFPAAANVMLVNDGAGVFSAVALPGNNVQNAFFVRSGDFDGNGQPDVVVSTRAAVDTQEILYNQGGSLVSVGTATFPGPVAVGIEVADLNADGSDELIRGVGMGVAVHLASAGGLFGPAVVQFSFPWPVPGAPPHAIDVDQDGDRDVVAGGRTVLFNDSGLGLTPEPVTGPPVVLSALGVSSGDLDQDGDSDFVHFGSTGAFARVNDGAGNFTTVPLMAGPTSLSLAPPVIFDSDGDGDLDVLINVEAGVLALAASVLIRNDLPAGLSILTGLPGVLGASRIRPGDVDLDGDLDLVVGAGHFSHPGPPLPPNFILLNQGGNVFAAPVPIDAAATPGQTMDIEVVDVDADGDLDVIEANDAVSGGTASRLLLNNGAGAFTPSTSFPSQFASAVEVADLDGDGDPDVILGATIYSNNGLGVFTSPGALTAFAAPNTLPASPQALTVRDFDADGVFDVLVQGLASGVPAGTRFMKGLSPFTFGAAELIGGWGTTIFAEHLVADIDRDGDVDVILGSDVLACARRQLALEGVARVGRPFHLDVFAPGGAGYALFASLGRADLSVPPFGQLLIDPAAAVQIAAGTIPAAGFGRTTLQVPNIATLWGVTVYWQAFSVVDIHLTNMIATTILQ